MSSRMPKISEIVFDAVMVFKDAGGDVVVQPSERGEAIELCAYITIKHPPLGDSTIDSAIGFSRYLNSRFSLSAGGPLEDREALAYAHSGALLALREFLDS